MHDVPSPGHDDRHRCAWTATPLYRSVAATASLRISPPRATDIFGVRYRHHNAVLQRAYRPRACWRAKNPLDARIFCRTSWCSLVRCGIFVGSRLRAVPPCACSATAPWLGGYPARTGIHTATARNIVPGALPGFCRYASPHKRACVRAGHRPVPGAKNAVPVVLPRIAVGGDGRSAPHYFDVGGHQLLRAFISRFGRLLFLATMPPTRFHRFVSSCVGRTRTRAAPAAAVIACLCAAVGL